MAMLITGGMMLSGTVLPGGGAEVLTTARGAAMAVRAPGVTGVLQASETVREDVVTSAVFLNVVVDAAGAGLECLATGSAPLIEGAHGRSVSGPLSGRCRDLVEGGLYPFRAVVTARWRPDGQAERTRDTFAEAGTRCVLERSRSGATAEASIDLAIPALALVTGVTPARTGHDLTTSTERCRLAA